MHILSPPSDFNKNQFPFVTIINLDRLQKEEKEKTSFAFYFPFSAKIFPPTVIHVPQP